MKDESVTMKYYFRVVETIEHDCAITLKFPCAEIADAIDANEVPWNKMEAAIGKGTWRDLIEDISDSEVEVTEFLHDEEVLD